VFSLQALEQAWRETTKPYDREHVTPYLRESGHFKTACMSHTQDLSSLRWTVDEPADFEVIERVFEHFHPRVDFTWALNDRQELRFLVAPFGFNESGTLAGPVNFNGASFNAASPTDITYRFNSYRATWRYRVFQDRDWTIKLGVTGNIRQAKIALAQGGISSSYSNVGFVPLLNVWAERRFSERWRLILDLDALGSPQGRAVDFSAKVGYQLNPNLTLTAGLRVLDGGADNDRVYNFARFSYGIVSAIYQF
jgi:hypothetical protein